MAKTKLSVNLNIEKVVKQSEKLLKEALEDTTSDLVQMSSQAAPIDEKILEGKHDERYWKVNDVLKSEVSYSVLDNGFDYAFWVHEKHPVGGIGEDTKNKPAGTSPISKKSHPAGGNFLKGPLDLNRKAYIEYIEKHLKSGL